MNSFFGFLLGVAGSLTAAVIWTVMGDRLLRSLGGSSFSLSGVWLAAFEPISPRPSLSIELVTMLHTGDTVRFRLENHNGVSPRILRCRGMGKYRSSQLSAVWYLAGKGEQESGVFVLRSRSTDVGSTILSGVYVQFVDREGTGDVSLHQASYSMRRIDLPLKNRLRRLCRGTYFGNYKELKAWLASANLWDEVSTEKGTGSGRDRATGDD